MTWRDDAACRGLAQPWHDPWHPEDATTNATLYDEARAICDVCPVWQPCLADAMATESGRGLRVRHGMRAGTTPRERWAADPLKPATDQAEEAA